MAVKKLNPPEIGKPDMTGKSPKTGKNGRHSKRKIVLAVVLTAVCVVGILTAVLVLHGHKYAEYRENRRTVASCNGYDIPYEELRFVTMFYKDALEKNYGKDIWEHPDSAEKYRPELEELVQEHLKENYVILSACRHLNIPTEGKDITKYTDKQMKELGEAFRSKKEYRAWLEEHWMTEHYMRFSIDVSYLESALHYTLLDNKLYPYRADNIDEFLEFVESGNAYVRTIHIYIENEEGESPEENLKQAKEISDRLRGEVADDIRYRMMCEYIGGKINDDLQNVSRDGYYFTIGEMDEDYEKAAFGLKDWEVSEPVVCKGGNFIVMRLPLEEEYIAKNAKKLLDNYHGVALGLYEDQFRDECRIVFNDYGKGIDLVAMQ